MIPVKFDESNRVFTAPAGMPDCQDLHTFQDGEKIISCWEMTSEEKISALFFGRVWLFVWGNGTPPVSLLAAQSAFSNEDEAKTDWEAVRKEAIDSFIDRKAKQFTEDFYVTFPIGRDTTEEMLKSFLKFALGINSVDQEQEKVNG